ncbi:S9 family peptidase [Parabacteroides bouchesdurhonensis]|uniref:S9 family peptidase n=1 Tax=Parabacteroides bouchesdurhonensis TaxID=1936995 RepID=UPI000C846EAC|nr:prolyl oligopeptidase family serine peptidase [Parabacteroides bouchesdurhonensis]
MKKKICFILVLFLSIPTLYAAKDVKVMQYKHVGPITVNKPFMADTMNVNGKPYEVKNLLKSTLPFDRALSSSEVLQADTAGTVSFAIPQKGYALHLFSFFLNSDRYVKGTLEVTGNGAFEVYVNDNPVGSSSDLTMEPRRYEIVIKYLTTETDTCNATLKTVFKSKDNAEVIASLNPEKRYTLNNILEGKDFRGIAVSPNGKYTLVKYINRFPKGKSESYSQLLDATTGRVLLQDNGFLTNARWMPKSNLLYYTRKGLNGKELITVDPTNMRETVLVDNLPEGTFKFTPDEASLLFTVEEEGPKEGNELIRVLEPNDRLPGFRDRSFIWRYDLRSGLYEQLTFGYQDTYINDISADGRYLLFSIDENTYTELPHTRSSLYKMDLTNMAVDTIWEKAPYVNQAAFSPDGKQLLVTGSGDAFDGIGLNIKEGQLSNDFDGQLFIYNLTDRKATPLTKDFNPNVMNAVWNRYDGQIYILTEDQDCQYIYTCNPVNGKIKQIVTSEEVISGYSLANAAPVLFYYGQSASNANRLYAYDLKGGKSKLMYDLSSDKLKDIVLGEVHDWNFTSDDGTTIQGRYYLPPHFDPSKKYPMIVYYYGGTAPTNRMLEMRYSMHMYAALGYVVYTLNPSGTTGFGQEFAARHVNAWGIKTADEIIKGTKLFCKEHNFVNDKKIGCIGASYGGFMTQYLQTRTDIFAAAISHAGISALSSYWGEGYWGYGYCSVANKGTYPWNNPEFFTKQSPLFNADKINTPILLLHGNVDTNVPIGESIQMFAALKILGKTVEFVQVDGENHGIMGYSKRIGWQNTIFAWFAKWLKDEPEWWTAMYPERTL